MRLVFLLLMAFGTAVAAQQRVPASEAETRLSFAPVVRRSAPAVVNIYATRVVAERVSPFADDPFFSQFFGLSRTVPRAQNSLGSGVILGSEGIVVSNHHVVGDATDIRVVLSDRREFEGDILLSDPEADIAVIRLRGARDLPALELGASDMVEVGDLVLAIGNPFGVGQTVTSGIVSGLARGTGPGDRAGYYIQTDAPINPGNSGGALVDMDGRLLGINTSILTRSGGSNGIGFAIPSALVAEYIRQAEAGATHFVRPWLGAAVQEVDMAMARALEMPSPLGVMITEMHTQSPLAAAGLAPGDVVLTLDEHPVYSAAELDFRLAVAGPRQIAKVGFLAAGSPGTAEMPLAPPPDTPPAAPVRIEGPTPFDGLTAALANPRLIEQFGLPLSATGVVVLDASGFAARAGMRPGDRVIAINGEAVTDTDTLERLATRRERVWDIELMRGGRQVRLRFRG